MPWDDSGDSLDYMEPCLMMVVLVMMDWEDPQHTEVCPYSQALRHHIQNVKNGCHVDFPIWKKQ